MSIDQVLEALEQLLPSGRLGPIEELVLHQSWLGRTYSEMAQDSGYGSNYLKEVGSQLWQDVSAALGQRVTKKNLHLVLNQRQQNRAEPQKSQRQQEFQPDFRTAEDYLARTVETGIDLPGSPLPAGYLLYVDRPPIEEITCAEISKPGCVIRLRAPSKMGKSSLLNRIVAHARTQGYQTVNLDFKEADETIFASLDKFLRWFCANISRQLNLNPRLEDFWDEDMGSKVSCKIYLEGYLLEQINSPLVIVLNEVNRVFEHPTIAQDFLPMLRFWHEQAKQDKTWQKLRLVLAHTTEIYVPLKLNQSPFNIGLVITLPPFTLKQVQDLAQRYGLDCAMDEEGTQTLAPLWKMVGGHPYLISLAFYHLSQRRMTLTEILQSAPTLTGIYSYHLRNHLTLIREEPQLVSALQRVVASSESMQLDANVAYKLESMGLIRLDGNQARPNCELYRLYFREQLGEENWIDTHSKQLEQAQKIQHLGNIDKLTQLPDRISFNQYFQANWQQWDKENSLISLLVCQIDYFKFFQDAYGEEAGDSCLKLVASTICECVGHKSTFVARYGWMEFAVVLIQIDPRIACRIAENIRANVKALGLLHDQSKIDGFPAQVVTVSVGVASQIPNPQTSPAMLIAAAEEALGQAKRQGCDRVSVLTRGLGASEAL